MMKHQYKERLGVVRKVVLLPLCVGLLTLFSFTEKSVVTETELPMVSAQAKVELPEPMMLEEFPDSIADREFVPLPDLPKSDATPMTILPQVKEPFSIQIESKVQPQKVEVADRIGIDLQANQVVLSRASFRKKCFVRFIDRTREDTRVTLAVPIYYDRHWIQFEKGFSILDEDTKDVYRIRSLTRGMEINQTYWIVGHEGQMVEFTLVFPPLDKKVKTITICDCFPEEKGIIPPNGGAWDLAHINIHRLAPTASRQSEYDRDGYPLRPDKLEEVTLPANQLNVSSRQNGGNAQIQRIETLPDKTLVTLNVPIHFNRHWVSIGKGMCLVDSKTGGEYPILGEANGMEMNKLLWIEGCQGGSVFLTLVFPKLPNKVKVIDLYDKYPDAGIVSPKGGISWDWRNIKIKDYRKELYKRIVL